MYVCCVSNASLETELQSLTKNVDNSEGKVSKKIRDRSSCFRTSVLTQVTRAVVFTFNQGAVGCYQGLGNQQVDKNWPNDHN